MMQKLFDHMEQDHGLILTQSELQDIVSASGCDVRLLLERMVQERDIARAKLAEVEAANAELRKDSARLDAVFLQHAILNKERYGNFYLAETRGGIDEAIGFRAAIDAARAEKGAECKHCGRAECECSDADVSTDMGAKG